MEKFLPIAVTVAITIMGWIGVELRGIRTKFDTLEETVAAMGVTVYGIKGSGGLAQEMMELRDARREYVRALDDLEARVKVLEAR